jgi:PhnB protein
MRFVPYLSFDGDCREAFEFYHQVLGGELVMMMTHGDMDPEGEWTPAGWKDRIIHARLVVGEEALMGGDAPPDSYGPPNMSTSVQVDSIEHAERIFDALAEGGSIQMPLEQQPWAARFGMATDKYGIPWMVNCETSP